MSNVKEKINSILKEGGPVVSAGIETGGGGRVQVRQIMFRITVAELEIAAGEIPTQERDVRGEDVDSSEDDKREGGGRRRNFNSLISTVAHMHQHVF